MLSYSWLDKLSVDKHRPAQLSKERRRAPGAEGLGAVGGLPPVKGVGLGAVPGVLTPKACCIKALEGWMNCK